MRQSLARFSEPESSVRTQFLVGYITIMCGFRFSVYTTLEFRDSILDRLHALHQSVGLINREDWKGVWLHELLQTELAPVADRIDISGRDALLKPKAAQSLSLLFYELMTNS
jgi:two-component sensor histidine kinase